jgi:hypothetical protein
MRVRSLMVGATLLAAVCGGGIAHAGSKAPGTIDNLDALFQPTQFGQQGGAGTLDALAQGMNIQLGDGFDTSGHFNTADIQSSSAYDGLLLSAPSLDLPYVALTSDSSYVGSTVSVADGLRLRLGVSSLSAQNPEIPAFGDLARFDGPQQYDLRSARTGIAGMDWDFASWGGLGIVASHTAEQNGVLGSPDAGSLSLAKSATSTTLGTSAHVGFGGGWVTTVSYSQGITNLDLRASGLEPGAETLHSSSYGLAIAKHGVFGNDSLGFSVIRPIDSYSGNIGFQPYDGFDTGTDMSFGRWRDSLLGQTPETDLELGYVTSFFNGALALQANAGYQMNLAGQSGTNGLSVISRAKINF